MSRTPRHQGHTPATATVLLTLTLLSPGLLHGAAAPAGPGARPSSAFAPDPHAVRRWGPAYCYPQHGWTVLHIEGEPFARGEQHGRLLAAEIAAHVRCFAAVQSPKDPASGWTLTRTLTSALFLRRFAREYLEEMKGIAAGASAAGARFDDRPLDELDIAALNCWPELESLDSALDALPTGLEGFRPTAREAARIPRVRVSPKPEHCSAFAATGPATRDGKVVIGHITMFGLYPASFYNVWLDVKPSKGRRVLMQTYPGGIQSGMDYYQNDAGLVVAETTIGQTRFDPAGAPLASRIRQALQYSESIDEVVAALTKENNGLYTNEWLLADTRTDEIALFTLGTRSTRLRRSSKGEWFGGTEGFYWGCNNAKDLEVRLETVASPEAGRPGRPLFVPSDRDRAWLRLYDKHKGRIDGDFARLAFTTPPLAAYSSLDAKFTTSALARDLKSWALFGPPLGRTWQPTFAERTRFPEIRPLVSNPWTLLHGGAPAELDPPQTVPLARDLLDPAGKAARKPATPSPDDTRPATLPVWRGTLRPKTDADLWLALAWPAYERWAALDRAQPDAGPTPAGRDRLGVELLRFRSLAALGARPASPSATEPALAALRADPRDAAWGRLAEGKGSLLLHALRSKVGPATFDELMDDFGSAHGGAEVTTAQFRAHAEKATGQDLGAFFAAWLERPGLPMLKLGRVTETPRDGWVEVEVEVLQTGGGPGLRVPVTVTTATGEVTGDAVLDGKSGTARLMCDAAPRRVDVDRHGLTPRGNGGAHSVTAFSSEVEEALIVVGTADDEAAQREAGVALQEALRRRGSNVTVPVKTDAEVTDADLKNHHLILIGRPATNRITERLRAALPVTFGAASFRLRGETYAHPDTAVLVAGQHGGRLVLAIAGLGARATRLAVERLADRSLPAGEVVIIADDTPRALLALPAELGRDLGGVRVEMEP